MITSLQIFCGPGPAFCSDYFENPKLTNRNNISSDTL